MEEKIRRIEHLKGLIEVLLEDIDNFGETSEDAERIRDYRKEVKELENNLL